MAYRVKAKIRDVSLLPSKEAVSIKEEGVDRFFLTQPQRKLYRERAAQLARYYGCHVSYVPWTEIGERMELKAVN